MLPASLLEARLWGARGQNGGELSQVVGVDADSGEPELVLVVRDPNPDAGVFVVLVSDGDAVGDGAGGMEQVVVPDATRGVGGVVGAVGVVGQGECALGRPGSLAGSFDIVDEDTGVAAPACPTFRFLGVLRGGCGIGRDFRGEQEQQETDGHQ